MIRAILWGIIVIFAASCAQIPLSPLPPSLPPSVPCVSPDETETDGGVGGTGAKPCAEDKLKKATN